MRLLEAQTRDEVIDAALFYVHRRFSYVALLVVRNQKLVGWNALGPSHEKILEVEIDPEQGVLLFECIELTVRVGATTTGEYGLVSRCWWQQRLSP